MIRFPPQLTSEPVILVIITKIRFDLWCVQVMGSEKYQSLVKNINLQSIRNQGFSGTALYLGSSLWRNLGPA